MRVVGYNKILMFTLSKRTLLQVYEKNISRLIAAVNANPFLIELYPLTIEEKIIKYKSQIQLINRLPNQKFYVFNQYYAPLSKRLHLEEDPRFSFFIVQFYDKFFSRREQPQFYILQNEDVFHKKRLPRHYLLVDDELEVGKIYYKVFIPIPNIRKLPYPPINFIPIEKDGKVVFIKKNKVNEIKEILK